MKSLIALLAVLLPLTAGAEIVEKSVEYKSKSGETFEGFVAYESGGAKRPGVLVVHNWLGLTDETKDKARAVAKLGYVAFAADIYGKGVRPEQKDAGTVAGKYKGDRELYRRNLWLAYDTMLKQEGVDKNKTAAIGYCFGGTGVIEMARSGSKLKGVVSFHGGLDSPPAGRAKSFKTAILALHGADDPFEKPEDLAAFEDEMRAAKANWQLVKYGGAVHSFTDKSAGNDNSKGAAYNANADRKSWEEMKNFFAEIF